MQCNVNGCNTTEYSQFRIFGIPIAEKLRNKWLDFLKSSGLQIEDPTTHYCVCEKHFEKNLIINYLYKTRLVPDAVPTILFNKTTPVLSNPLNISIAASKVPKCAVKCCKSPSQELFVSPENPERLKKWQLAVDTNEDEFWVCEDHFIKKDMIIEKTLDDNAVPFLNLSHKTIKLKSQCCGLCLGELFQKQQISKSHSEAFKEISGFPPLTDLICPLCRLALEKYIEFKTKIQQRHAKVWKDASMAEIKRKMSAKAFAEKRRIESIQSKPKEDLKLNQGSECNDAVLTKDQSDVEIGEECIADNGSVTVKEEPVECMTVKDDQVIKIKEGEIEIKQEEINDPNNTTKSISSPPKFKVMTINSRFPTLPKNVLEKSIKIKGFNVRNVIPLQAKPITIIYSNQLKTIPKSSTNLSSIQIKAPSSSNSIPIRIKSINGGSFVSMAIKNSETIGSPSAFKIAKIQQNSSAPIQKISSNIPNTNITNETTSTPRNSVKHTKRKFTPLRPVESAKENHEEEALSLSENLISSFQTLQKIPSPPRAVVSPQPLMVLKETIKVPKMTLAKRILIGRFQRSENDQKRSTEQPQKSQMTSKDVEASSSKELQSRSLTLDEPRQPSQSKPPNLNPPQEPPKVIKKARRKTPHESLDNQIKCPECKILFTSIESFLNHRDTVHPEKAEINALIRKQLIKVKCDHCSAVMVEAKMMDHVRAFHTTECEICFMKFNSLMSLDKHMVMIHLNEKESTCDICGEICQSKNEIEKHMEECHLS